MTFLHAFLILLALMLVIGAGLFAAFVIACYTDDEPRPNLPASLGTPLDAVDVLEAMRAERDASTVYPDVALFAADVRRDIRALPDLWDVAP